MVTKPRKTTTKASCQASLSSTRLKLLSVNSILPPEESGTGTLKLNITIQRLPSKDAENTVVIRLNINGEGLPEDKDSEKKIAFTIEAALDGIYDLSRKPNKGEMEGCEANLAGYLLPILSDMIETVLSKCGYIGIAFPRSFPFKPNSAAVSVKQK